MSLKPPSRTEKVQLSEKRNYDYNDRLSKKLEYYNKLSNQVFFLLINMYTILKKIRKYIYKCHVNIFFGYRIWLVVHINTSIQNNKP